MKNKFFYTALVLLLSLTTTSCRKSLYGSDLTITTTSNQEINNLRVYLGCSSINDPAMGWPFFFELKSEWNYEVFLTDESARTECLTVYGIIPENNATAGFTKVRIDAFFTEHGNIVGFQEIEIKRPHGEQIINYKFSPETYLE